MKQRKIVCSAIIHNDGFIVAGVRHYDMVMNNMIRQLPEQYRKPVRMDQQGFLDQYGDFLTREDALKIAVKNGQIEPKTGNQDCTRLYSEDLY